MLLDDIENYLNDLDNHIEDVLIILERDFARVNSLVAAEIIKSLEDLQTKNGRFVRGQNLTKTLVKLDAAIKSVLGSKGMETPVREFFNLYTTIEDRNVAFRKTQSGIIVTDETLSGPRKFIQDQAEYYLRGAGLADGYITPAKFLLRQQAATGASLSGARDLIKEWDSKGLAPEQTAGRPAPNLQKYATQLARDSSYQYNGVINDTIKARYDLKEFIYAGGLKKASRPLCRHLVGLKRPIKYAEIDDLLKQYPEGVIPGTNAGNFDVYRGGFNCEHLTYPI